MKKAFVLISALLMMVAANAQSLLFETFDNGIPATWTTLGDGLTAMNPNFTEPWSVTDLGGDPVPCAVSTSWLTTRTDADRWLITAPVFVSDSGYSFALEAACLENSYPDGFEVRVSTRGNYSKSLFDAPIISVMRCTETFVQYTASLDAYVGDTVHIAIIQNSYDKNLLFVDNVRVCRLSDEEILLASLVAPVIVMPESSFRMGGIVKNLSSEPLVAFDYSYIIDGIPQGDLRHVADSAIAPGASHYFVCDTAVTLADGFHTLELTVYPVSVSSRDNAANNSQTAILVVADTTLPTGSVERMTLVEQFVTNSSASYNSMLRIGAAIEQLSHSIWLNYHVGDNLSSTASSQAYNEFGTPAVPSFMVDRTSFYGSEQTPVIACNTPYSIPALWAASQSAPCYLRLSVDSLSFNESTRQLTAEINGQAIASLQGDYRLRVYFVEDSIHTYQFLDRGHIIRSFRNPYTVRQIVLDTVVADMGNLQYAVNYMVPANYNAWRCKLVAFVYKNGETASQRNVVNAAQSANIDATYVGVDEVGGAAVLNVYPNPASALVNIDCDGEMNMVSVTDIMGRVVYADNAVKGCQMQLDVRPFATGLYVVTVRSDKGLALKRFAVVR